MLYFFFYLVLLLSHLIGDSLCELGLRDRRWLLGGGATVVEPLGERLMRFLRYIDITGFIAQ